VDGQLESTTDLPLNGEGSGRRPPKRRQSTRRPRRGGTALFLLLIVLVAAAVALLAWIAVDRSSSPGTSDVIEPLPTALAELERRDLVERETLKGTLGLDVLAVVSETRPGTITELAPEGSLIERGDVVYRLDERPTVFLNGAIPAFRTLERGVNAGSDVFQLEFNLVELGYDPDREIVPNNQFGRTTERAVKRWQRDLGIEDTGVVALGDVLFFPTAQRFGTHLVDVGARIVAPTALAEITSIEQVVSLDLDTDRQDLLNLGDVVAIEIPGSETIGGVVLEIGTEATEVLLPDGSSAGTTVPVTIGVTGAIPSGLTNTPVDVVVIKQSRENALVAPVIALVALKGGGYAIETVSDTTTVLLGVEPGLYADGFVEIGGSGLTEGMKVVVPE
jgi:peptidoglycan hydrolase-like protein with peptidoglycan-binding domain